MVLPANTSSGQLLYRSPVSTSREKACLCCGLSMLASGGNELKNVYQESAMIVATVTGMGLLLKHYTYHPLNMYTTLAHPTPNPSSITSCVSGPFCYRLWFLVNRFLITIGTSGTWRFTTTSSTIFYKGSTGLRETAIPTARRQLRQGGVESRDSHQTPAAVAATVHNLGSRLIRPHRHPPPRSRSESTRPGAFFCRGGRGSVSP